MKKYLIIFAILVINSCSEQSSSKVYENRFYDRAFIFLEKNQPREAFIDFNKAKDLFINQKDSFGAGKCLINMAVIQEQLGDNFGSQETSLSAIKYFNPNDSIQKEYLISNYNSLGMISSKLEENGEAIKFYDKVLTLSPPESVANITYNNIANVYRRQKKYSKAIGLYRNILQQKVNDKEYARILSNFAFTKWLQNSSYNPIPELEKALKGRLDKNDLWGQNASYSHLADYYFSKNISDSALFYSNKMFTVAKQLNSPDDKIEALQKLIRLENANNSQKYFQIYQNLSDSLQTARNKAKNQFALIRYETEKNKADFLKAQSESAKRRNVIIWQSVILILSISLIIWFIAYVNRRKKIHLQEKLLEVRNTELKYSKKVHDRVANRIYQILSKVEHTDHIDKESILFGLENVYNISRDISYDNTEINENQHFSEQLNYMMLSYASDSTHIFYNGNKENLWEGINFQTKTEIYLTLQELMTNMKKHSQADKVFLKFSKENRNVNISYTDNGIGLRDSKPKNGMQNMENRINAINGTINFDTETNLMKVNISFPI